MRLFFAAVSVACLLEMTSCYDPHAQSSAIVRQVEAAGSGDLAYLTIPGIGEFLAQRPALVEQVNRECQPIRQRANAHWIETSEGKVCAIARTLGTTTWTGDHRAW